MTEEILAATPVDPAVDPGASAAADAPGRTRRAPALSPSRTNDYVQCPLLFRFRTIDRLPEPPSQAAARGTLVHAVLEDLFGAPAGERTPAVAHALVPGAWEKLLHERPEYSTMFADADEAERWLGTAGPLLDTYFTLEDPNRLEPRARELLVEVELDPGESAVAEAGSLVWKDASIGMTTVFGDGSADTGGGFMGKAHAMAYAAMPMFFWPAPAIPHRKVVVDVTDGMAERTPARRAS